MLMKSTGKGYQYKRNKQNFGERQFRDLKMFLQGAGNRR
jgi:hypothetical protein